LPIVFASDPVLSPAPRQPVTMLWLVPIIPPRRNGREMIKTIRKNWRYARTGADLLAVVWYDAYNNEATHHTMTPLLDGNASQAANQHSL